MKKLLLLAITFATLFACRQSDGPKPESLEPTKALTQMDPRVARQAIEKWDSIRTNTIVWLDSMGKASDSMYVVKGFHVPFDDINSLVHNIGDKSQLFAMLAVETDEKGNPRFALIFQAPDTSKQKTIQYYDFTKPCPNNCPQ